jgi:hypothetical protein
VASATLVGLAIPTHFTEGYDSHRWHQVPRLRPTAGRPADYRKIGVASATVIGLAIPTRFAEGYESSSLDQRR